MKKNSPSKRLLSLLLCLALFLSLGVSSFAEARMESAPAVEERGTFKPAELREDGSPDGAASRTEESEAAPQPDEPKADYAVFVYIVDDSTGAYPQHGTVSLAGDYQAFPYEEYRYMVARGDTLTVSAAPDEGYLLDPETFRVTYRSSSTSTVDKDLPLDETNAFTVSCILTAGRTSCSPCSRRPQRLPSGSGGPSRDDARAPCGRREPVSRSPRRACRSRGYSPSPPPRS